MTIHELVANAHANSLSKGWWDDKSDNFPEKLMLIVAEAAEAMEEYRNTHSDSELNGVYYVQGKPEGFPVELADVVIRVADLCGRLNIDLDHVIDLKMKYNETRPRRHGGKRA